MLDVDETIGVEVVIVIGVDVGVEVEVMIVVGDENNIRFMLACTLPTILFELLRYLTYSIFLLFFLT